MIRILVADDHVMVRQVLRRIFERAGDIQIVAMASNGQEAVDHAIQRCPNVAVMDVSMPLMDGIAATSQIRVHCPKTRVLILSMHNTVEYIRRSLWAGALGYVLKDTAVRDLITAIRSVSRGHPYFSKEIAEIARHLLRQREPGASPVDAKSRQ